MPKLDKDTADKVREAESSFEALPDGLYDATLQDVTSGLQGPAGEYWTWTFGDLKDAQTGKAYAGRLWLNTSLSEKALWKMQETFAAFGAEPDDDTDDLLGQQVRLAVSQRVIEKGTRVGDIGNQIERVLGPNEEG